jgi:hypothetical protein
MEDKEELKNNDADEQESVNNNPTNGVIKQAKEIPKKLKVEKKSRRGRKHTTKKTVKSNSISNFQKPRQFPKATLQESLQVPLKIKELNGGNPWDTEDVANALGLGAKSNNFYYLTAAARDFGLTIGTRGAAKIELADLGKEIVYAPNPLVEQERKIEAFLKIDVFKKVLDYYKGSSLPEMKYLGNTLEKEFGLPQETHEEFSNLFRRNCQELGIESGVDNLRQAENYDGNVVNAPATVILGELKGTNKTTLKAFVIMPFVERDENYPKGFFSEVLRSLITPAALDAGFTVETANKQGSDIIQSTIINDLLEADLVIADLTAHNPNVLFELGVRMAQDDKPVALIKSTGTGRIFDVDNMLRVFEYDRNLWLSTIEKDLPKLKEHIKAAWDNREKNMSYMKILRRGVTSEKQYTLTS